VGGHRVFTFDLSRSNTRRDLEDLIMKKRFMLSAAGLSAAAIVGSAPADISFGSGPHFLMGGSLVGFSLGPITGTLTGITFSMYWENTAGDSSWASDMLIAVSDGSVLVSAGGYNLSFGGSGWGALNGSPATGTYTTYLSGSMAMTGSGAFYLANGWSGSGGTTTSFNVTLHGINAVPAPGALALLGLAGVAGIRRRRG
jgi:MYXO-CTERM domain-containing protein